MKKKSISHMKDSEIEGYADRFANSLYNHNHIGDALTEAGISAGSGGYYDIYQGVFRALKNTVVSEYHKHKKQVKLLNDSLSKER